MDIVALLSLGTPVEVEAPLLAADLGSTTYETALLLGHVVNAAKL